MTTPTISWALDGDGNWSNADDWSLARLPNSTDDVAINTPHLHTVTFSTGSATIHSLTVGANSRLLMSGGLLRWAFTSSFGNLLTVSGGTLAPDATTTVAAFSQSGGTLAGSGSMTVFGAATFTGTSLQTARGQTVLDGASTFSGFQLCLDGGRTLENHGTFTVTGSGNIKLGFNPFGASLGGATLKNDAGATLNLEGVNFITSSSGVTAFNNPGLLERTVGTLAAIVDVALTNTGKVSAATGILEIDRAFTTSGAGTIAVASGATLDIHGGGSANAAAVTVAAGGLLEITGLEGLGVAFSLGAGTVAGTGAVTVDDAALGVEGDVTLAGAFTVSGVAGSAFVDAGDALHLLGGGSSKASGLSVAAGGALDFAGGKFLLTAGLGSVGGTGTVEVSGGRLTVKGDVTVDGSFAQSGGTLAGNGAFAVDGAATFKGAKMAQTGSGVTLLKGSSTLSGGRTVLSLDGGRVLENQGTFVCVNGDFRLGSNPFGTSVGGGTIQNDAGAVFNLQETAFIVGVNGTTAFNNAGTFEQTVTTGDTQMDVAFTNTGTLSVQNGQIALAGGGSSSGAIVIAAGAVLSVGPIAAGSTFTLGGTVSGPGTLEVSGGVMAVGADLTLGGDLLQLESTVAGAGNLTVTGAATFASAGFPGALLQTGSGVTVLEGASRYQDGTVFALDGGRTLEIQKTLILTGTGVIALGDNPFGAALGGGVLKIDAGATLDIQGANQVVGGAGATALINAGTLKKTTGAGLAVIGVAVTDSGAIRAAAGTLDLAAAIGGGGSMSVGSGATLEADSSAASTLAMTFNGGGGTLALGDPANFAATIRAFAPTDTIDLLNIVADAATLGAGDTLTITNGATTIATLQLAGNFQGDTFHVAADGHGGTSITLTTPAPVAGAPGAGHRFAAAMAGLGTGGAVAHGANGAHFDAWRPMLSAPRMSYA